MAKNAVEICIHMADDDEDDRLIFKEAMDEARVNNKITYSVDGQDLIDFLQRTGKYTDLVGSPLPDLILLDLNMPRKDGRDALREIKADKNLRRIPIVILTTSQAEQDIISTYDIGASSFISKPVSFEGLVKVVKEMSGYWIGFVKLPE